MSSFLNAGELARHALQQLIELEVAAVLGANSQDRTEVNGFSTRKVDPLAAAIDSDTDPARWRHDAAFSDLRGGEGVNP